MPSQLQKGRGLICLILSVLLAILLIASYAVAVAPFFSSIILSCIVAVMVFVYTEAAGLWFVHRANELESRFWTIIFVVIAAAVLFVSDSPLPIGREYPFLAVVILFGVLNFVNFYDRQLTKQNLIDTPNLPRVSSRSVIFDSQASQSAKEKTHLVLPISLYQPDLPVDLTNCVSSGSKVYESVGCAPHCAETLQFSRHSGSRANDFINFRRGS